MVAASVQPFMMCRGEMRLPRVMRALGLRCWNATSPVNSGVICTTSNAPVRSTTSPTRDEMGLASSSAAVVCIMRC